MLCMVFHKTILIPLKRYLVDDLNWCSGQGNNGLNYSHCPNFYSGCYTNESAPYAYWKVASVQVCISCILIHTVQKLCVANFSISVLTGHQIFSLRDFAARSHDLLRRAST